MDDIRTVLPFYSASGWIYCGDVWLLFQNSLQLMSCGVCICRHVAVTSDLVTLLFSRCALAITLHLGPLFTVSVLLVAYCLNPVHDLQYACRYF